MLRKPLTILSLVGLLLSAGLWGVSYFRFRCFTEAHVVDLAAGGIKIVADSNPPDAILTFSLNFGTVEAARAFDEYAERLREMMDCDRRWMIGGFSGLTTDWKPQAKRLPLTIAMPLWIPTLLFGVAFSCAYALPLHRRNKRRKLGLCLKCGYDLRGSKERCSECGTGFSK